MALVKLDLGRRLGEVDPKVYGMFIEHLGRCIYGGIYDPGSPLSSDDGIRLDVLEAAQNLPVPLLRWPGGNFASGYHWLDGVGPKSRRPVRPELAWNTIETNQFGTNEFIQYCRLLDAEPYVCVNLGDGTIEEAATWVEYCNRAVGTSYANLRAEHGFTDPHRVTYWGLGNELYGDWQIGHKKPDEHAHLARQCAQLMRMMDKDIKLVLCGAGEHDWDRLALRECADVVDYISYHFYWARIPGQDAHYSTLARPYESEQYLSFLGALIAQIRRERRVKHPIGIAVDEWNRWFIGGEAGLGEVYNLSDALSVAIYLNMMRRHCRTITLATLAQMVNVIAPIITSPEGMYLQTIYFPLQLAAAKSGAIALDAHVVCDSYAAGYVGVDAVPYLDVLATFDEGGKKLYLSLVNLYKDQPQEVAVRLDGAEVKAAGLAHVISGEAPEVTNGFEAQRVGLTTEPISDAGAAFSYTLPPHTHAVLELDVV
jgi:alpha-N-arabinofuranosidase